MLWFSHWAAFAAGLALPIIETYRRWEVLSDWPAWLDDYIAAALLLYAWRAGQASLISSRPYLMAAWGYTMGIAYMSFFGQWSRRDTTDISGYSTEFVLGFKGFGLVLAGLALLGAWRGARVNATPEPKS